MPTKVVLAVALACLPGVAGAQDLLSGGFDGHGAVAAPGEGDPDDLLWIWSPQRHVPWTFSATVLGEYANQPLVQDLYSGDELLESQSLVEHLGGANTALNLAFTDWAQLSVQLPVWIVNAGIDGSGLTLGDLRVAVPVTLVRPSEGGGGLGLGVLPYFDAPTGNAERFTGGGVGGGGTLALSGGPRTFRVTANAGARFSSGATYAGLSGLRVEGGLGAAWRPIDPLGIRLEGTVGYLPVGEDGTLPALPAELALSLRYQLPMGLAFTAGGATALTDGPGAAVVRGFFGLHFVARPSPKLEPVAEAPPATATVRVVDEAGQPLEEAELTADDVVVGWTDADGLVVLSGDAASGLVIASRRGFASATADLSAATDPVEVQLQAVPAMVTVTVRDAEDQPVDAKLLWSGPTDVAPARADGGSFRTRLEQGTWELLVTAPDLGVQQRTVDVVAGDTHVFVDVVLGVDEGGDADLVVRVTEEGVPLENAEVLIDGVPVGRTSTGGALTLERLQGGTRTVTVRKEAHETETSELQLRPGSQQVAVDLPLLPGALQVRVADTGGEPVDATVRFLGPESARPGRLGLDGEGLFTLAAGEWSILVSSPSFGLQQREVTILPDERVLVDVEVVLRAGEDGASSMVVRAVDPDGQPIPDALVFIDGEPVGATSSGGTVRLDELRLGRRLIEVRSSHHQPLEPATVDLVEGLQERLFGLSWLPGSVRVRARDRAGAAVAGTARFMGPESASPLALDARGEGWTRLTPGEWQVLVTQASLGAAQRDVLVPGEATALTRVDVVLGEPVEGAAALSVTVNDPAGEPVDGAALSVDGQAQGRTASGRAQLSELMPGRRELAVEAELHGTVTEQLDLAVGEQTHEVTLPWAGGAARAEVVDGDGAPLDATVRWLGPSAVPPARTGADGERVFALGPGAWSGLASSPTHGLQQQDIELVGNEADPVAVRFVLGAQPKGATDLLVRVVDPDGLPIEDAQVSIGGKPAGRTPQGGFVIADDVRRQATSIEVEASDYETRELAAVDLAGGVQEQWVTLPWVPVALPVRAIAADGTPVDARVQLDGPRETRIQSSLGDDGYEVFEVRPGDWRVVVSSEKLGTQQREVSVALGQDVPEVQVQLAEQKVVKTDAEFRILDKVLFATGSDEIDTASDALLEEVAASLIANPQVLSVEVQGHTDPRGSEELNEELSQRRAAAVVARLSALGVDGWRLEAKGYGASAPIASNDSDAGRAKNRRVQFAILEVEQESAASSPNGQQEE